MRGFFGFFNRSTVLYPWKKGEGGERLETRLIPKSVPQIVFHQVCSLGETYRPQDEDSNILPLTIKDRSVHAAEHYPGTPGEIDRPSHGTENRREFNEVLKRIHQISVTATDFF